MFLDKLAIRSEIFKRQAVELANALRHNQVLASEAMDKLDQAEEQRQRVLHDLEIERSKRIAAEQIAVSRETELSWLREMYADAIASREESSRQQFESLNLVNVTLLKQAESEAPPTKETLQGFKPVPKRGGAGVSLMRQAENKFLHQLRTKKHPVPEEKAAG